MYLIVLNITEDYIKINCPIKIADQYNSSFSKNFCKVQKCQFSFEPKLI